MYFPSNVKTTDQLRDHVRPLCNDWPRLRETYAVPWDCRSVMHCSYFGLPLYEVACNRDSAYSFAADGCVPHYQSDCPFYPLNTL